MIIQSPILRKPRLKRLFHVERSSPGFTWNNKAKERLLVYDSIGGPVDPRTTGLIGNSVISDLRSAKRASRYSAAATPAPCAGMRTLVSIGDTQRAKGVSPNPIIDNRPGTSMP